MESPQTLPITEPQPGQVITGFVVSHWQGPHGEYCLVVASAGVCHACRVDPVVLLQPANRVQLQAVALEHQAAPVWEVHMRHLGTQYELLPGQHCQSRTAPAEQWLQEIQANPLPKLTAELERVHAERLGHETQRQRINPEGQPELQYATALTLARKEVLGAAYAQVCEAVRAAERRSIEAAVTLHLHKKVKPNSSTVLPRPWDWWRRWREGRTLCQHLKLARGSHQRLEAQRRQLERAANEPGTITRVEQEAHRLVKADRALSQQLVTVTREERRANRQLDEARKLVQYLECRLGSQVTLQCPLVKGRAQMLPTITATAVVQPTTLAPSIRAVPAAKTNGGPASAPSASVLQPENTVEKPRVTPSLSGPRFAIAPAKSNGVRLRM